MKGQFQNSGRSGEVEIVFQGSSVSVYHEGQTFTFEYEQTPCGIQFTIGGRVHDVSLQNREGDAFLLKVNGKFAVYRWRDDRHVLATKTSSENHAKDELRAVMPGRVGNIYVRCGDSVEAGDPVIVLEAMKMENELKAPCTGIVDSIKVSAGDSVEMSALLVTFKPI
jgi:biotin carboxyl carrier protein